MLIDVPAIRAEFEKWFGETYAFDGNTEEGKREKRVLFEGYFAGYRRRLKMEGGSGK